MANRDVEFILRAKNEASNAIQSVINALDALSQAQGEAGSSASKADAEIGQLGQELARLAERSKGLDTLSALAGRIGEAETVLGKLSAKLQGAQTGLAAFEAENARVSASAAQLRESITTTTSALDSEKAALATTTALYKEVSREVASAGAAVKEFGSKIATSEASEQRFAERIAEASARLADLRGKLAAATSIGDTAGITRYAAQVELAEAKVAGLSAQLDGQKASTAAYRALLDSTKSSLSSLTVTQESLNQSVAAGKARVDGTKVALSTYESELSKANRAASSLTGSLSKASLDVERASADYKNGATAIEEMRSKSDALARTLKATSSDAQSLGTASSTTASELQKVSAALERVKAAGTDTLSVPERSIANYRSLIAQYKESEGALKAVRAEFTSLNREMSTLGVPTEALNRQFLLTREALAAAERQFLSAGVALNTFGGRANSSFLAFERGAANIKAPVQSLESLNAALSAARTRFETVSSVLTKLSQAYATSSTQTEAMREELVRIGTAARTAETEMLRAAAAVSSFRNQGSGSFLQLEAAIQRLPPPLAQTVTESVRASGSMRTLIGSILSFIGVTQNASGAGLSFANSIKSIYGESRQALSLMQRLRGEVLGYIAAYAGIQGVVNGLQSVVAATRSLEAATNRLGVVNNQSIAGVEGTIDKLRQRSLYLGQSFSTLSDEFSKFAIAANEANYTSDATEKIFNSVSVAARVNKLSVDQLKGVYLALTQMISKGKITSEELRRQLGDRLPGAFNLMAKALGMTTAELDAAMKQGEVFSTQDNLLKFAEQLDKSFGGQLPESLRTLTTQIDRLGASSEQAALRVGEGGFSEALRKLLELINQGANTRGGRDLFLEIGAAAGKAVDGVRFLAENFDLVRVAITGLLSLKAGSFILSLVNDFKKSAGEAGIAWTSFGGAVKATDSAFRSTGSSILSFGSSLGNAEGRAVALRTVLSGALAPVRLFADGLRAGVAGVYNFGASLSVASVRAGLMRTSVIATGAAVTILGNSAKAAVFGVRSLYAAMGGWQGIAASVASFFLADWLGSFLTKVDDATSKIDEHKRVIDLVAEAYTKWGKDTDAVAKELQNVLTKDQITANVREMSKLYQEAKAKAVDYYGGVETYAKIATTAEYAQIKSLRESFGSGATSAKDFTAALQKIYATTKNNSVKVYLETLLEFGRAAEAAEQRLKAAEEAAKRVGTGLPDFVEKTRIERFVDKVKELGGWLLEIGKWAAIAVAGLAVIGSIASKVSAGWGVVVALFARLGPIGTAIAATFARLAPLMAVLVNVVRTVATALAGIATGGAAAFGAVEIAIVALVAAAAYGAVMLVQNWEAVKAWFLSLSTTIPAFFASTWSSIASGAAALWSEVQSAAASAWNAIASAAASAASSIQSYFSAALDWVIEKAKSVAEWVAKAASLASGSGSTAAQGYAKGGGPISGPGTETSDSIPAWLSVNEFVMRAKAVRHYGAAFMSRLNSLSIPRYGFAQGGGFLTSAAVPAFASAGSTGRPINLSIGGSTFSVTATEDVANKLVAFARAADARSAGRSPNWKKGRGS